MTSDTSAKAARVTDAQVEAFLLVFLPQWKDIWGKKTMFEITREALEAASIAPDAEPVAPTVGWRWRNKRSTDTAWRYGPELPRDFNYGYWECEPLTNAAPLPAKDAVGEAKTFEDGLKAAAAWVAKRRDAYIEEHGSYDYSTGVTEFPGNGDETVCEWDEIEEGILALAAKSPPKDAQP